MSNISETESSVKNVETVNVMAVATTRLDNGNYLIDDKSYVIDETKQVPQDNYYKEISTNLFKYSVRKEHSISPEILSNIEASFVSLCKSNNITFGNKTFYKYQHVYFNGVITVLGFVPPKWGMCLMSSRPIVENYNPVKSITKKGFI